MFKTRPGPSQIELTDLVSKTDKQKWIPNPSLRQWQESGSPLKRSSHLKIPQKLFNPQSLKSRTPTSGTGVKNFQGNHWMVSLKPGALRQVDTIPKKHQTEAKSMDRDSGDSAGEPTRKEKENRPWPDVSWEAKFAYCSKSWLSDAGNLGLEEGWIRRKSTWTEVNLGTPWCVHRKACTTSCPFWIGWRFLPEAFGKPFSLLVNHVWSPCSRLLSIEAFFSLMWLSLPLLGTHPQLFQC